MALFRDYPSARLAEWMATEPVPARRAWKAFRRWAFDRYGDFANVSQGAGFGAAPKLLMAVAAIRQFQAAGRPLPATVGELLEVARRERIAPHYMPPADCARRWFRLAGRPDLAADLDPEIFGPR